MLKRKFTDWQGLRLAASHVLMIIDQVPQQVKDGINAERFTTFTTSCGDSARLRP